MAQMDTRIQELIVRLNLQPHPEGGYFREVYRSNGEIDACSLPAHFSGKRNYSTSIYFLLTSGNFSAFHKINQDEIWHFYEGSPIEMHVIAEDGQHEEFAIGNNLDEDQVLQLVIPGGQWFAARVIDENSYALVGCTVAPGFDFDDFELAKREGLLKKFPQHEALIRAFTRTA